MISEPTPNATQKKKTRDMLAKGKEKEKKKSTCKRLTRETTLNSDQMLGLLHTLNDSLDIQRPDTPKVDDLNLDTLFLLQQLGSLERVGDHLAVGDDGNVGTSLFNLGLADGDEEVLGEFFLGHGEMDTVEELVLKETNLQTEISFREIKKKKMARRTGLESLIALFNKPLQSEALQGETTFKPGTLPYHAQ